jgi:hypothetical protein
LVFIVTWKRLSPSAKSDRSSILKAVAMANSSHPVDEQETPDTFGPTKATFSPHPISTGGTSALADA